MTDLENKEREFHAKQLLNNPVFISLLEDINKEIGRDMDMVKADDLKNMQALVLLRQASTRIITHIVTQSESSKVSDFNSGLKRGLFKR